MYTSNNFQSLLGRDIQLVTKDGTVSASIQDVGTDAVLLRMPMSDTASIAVCTTLQHDIQLAGFYGPGGPPGPHPGPHPGPGPYPHPCPPPYPRPYWGYGPWCWFWIPFVFILFIPLFFW